MATETSTNINTGLPMQTEPRPAARADASNEQRTLVRQMPDDPAPKVDQGTSRITGDSQDRDMDEVVEKANERAEALDRKVRFALDQESGEVVVRVVNAETDEVIRQIPPQELLELSQKLEGSMEGLLIEITA